MPTTMRAARMHAVGAPMSIDTIPVPKPGSTDVLVQVKACGMVPNLGNVLANWTKWFPHLPLPKLPAIFGLDPAGVVAEVGTQVIGVKPGRARLCEPVAVLWRLPDVPGRRAHPLPLLHLQRLFRFWARRAENLRSLPLWWFLRIHDRAAICAGQTPRQRHLRTGRPFRLSRHLLWRDEEGERHRRPVHAGRWDQRHARTWRSAAGARNGDDAHSRDRPQQRTSRPGQGAGAGPHRGARARGWRHRFMGEAAHQRRRRRFHDQRARARALPRPPCSIHCRPFVGAVAPSMSARSPSPFPSTCIGSWTSRSS